MSLNNLNENNPLFGKKHSEEAKEKMRLKALGRKHSEDTKLLMSSTLPLRGVEHPLLRRGSSKRGSFVNVF